MSGAKIRARHRKKEVQIVSEYGYLSRCAAEGRDEEAMKAMNCVLPSECITVERVAGKGSGARPAFDKLIESFKPGDTLYVSSADRLGLNVSEIIRVWKTITQDKETNIVVLDTTWLDTRINPNIPVAYIKLAAECAFAEVIRRREKEGQIFSSISFADAALCEAI